MLKIDFSDSIVATDRLREQAGEFLRSKILAEPENIVYLTKLAHIMREMGNQEETLRLLSKILGLEPGNREAKQLMAILSKKPDSHPCNKGLCPAPFLYIEEFMTNDELSAIWDTIKHNRNNFMDSTTYGKIEDTAPRVNNTYRKSETLSKENLGDISKWFLNKVYSRLTEVWPYVHLNPFEQTLTEMQLTRHGNNGFFKIHQDSGVRESIRDRTLTFVFYLHKEPKHFSGGEILLFDTDTKIDEFGNKFTKMVPSNNSIIFFPSNYFHQVTPIHLEEDTFENGRFAIHGWLHK